MTELSKDHETALASVARIAAGVTAREAEAVDAEYRWPEDTMRSIQECGLAGLVVPTTYGGLGLGLRVLTEACEIALT
jgi:alkylation response protein AidB-like acyl-CoA dehydrogenase